MDSHHRSILESLIRHAVWARTSPELRAAARIERDIDLIGMGTHFEIWDRATHQAREAAVIDAGMPEAVRNIVV